MRAVTGVAWELVLRCPRAQQPPGRVKYTSHNGAGSIFFLPAKTSNSICVPPEELRSRCFAQKLSCTPCITTTFSRPIWSNELLPPFLLLSSFPLLSSEVKVGSYCLFLAWAALPFSFRLFRSDAFFFLMHNDPLALSCSLAFLRGWSYSSWRSLAKTFLNYN